MQVERTAEVAKRRRRARTMHAARVQAMQRAGAGAAERVVAPQPARTWRTFPLGPISRAGGEWTVDWERAHADAQKVLDAIDFSKRDIVIWVPGTSSHGPHRDFEAAVRDAWRGEGTNLVALEYEATWHLRRSVPTGIATLRLVLEGIRARGGDHRVLLSGESQGAWIIGETIADPAVGRVVDRAILLGHPWLAAHQYAAGQDPRVRVINHDGDQVTLPVRGDATVGLDAMIAIRTLQLSRIGDVVRALAANPAHGVLMLKSIAFAVPLLKALLRNPHVYGGEMTRAVEFLRHGSLPFSDSFARLAGLPPDPLLAHPEHDEAAHARLVRGAAIAAYASLRAA